MVSAESSTLRPMGSPRTSPFLDWRRVYVFPTRQGFGLGALLVVILLGAINYDNALAYLLCFLLAGLFLVAMLHTYHNLAGLGLVAARAEPVFAGTPAALTLAFDSRSARPRFSVRIARLGPDRPRGWWRRAPAPPATELPVLAADTPATLTLPPLPRGVHAGGRIRLESTFPLGFLRAWAYLPVATEIVVYPAPHGARPLPAGIGLAGAGALGASTGVEDFSGLRPYRAGDPLRAVDWRALARRDEWVVKQFRGAGGGAITLAWSALPATDDPETRLSQLAQWVLEAERAGLRFALELPGVALPAGSGPAHREQCLTALARHIA